LFGDSRDLRSIRIIREFEPEEGYYLAFSGGKDSVCLYDLAIRAGVKFDAHYSFTGIDPPELVRFIRDNYPNVHWERPKKSFYEAILARGLPTMTNRWCCELLKEGHGKGRIVLVGIRRAESYTRSQYTVVRNAPKLGKIFVNPMLLWTDDDVWEYIRRRNLPYCSLYDEGWKRLGCVPCPFNRDIRKAMKRWPKMFNAIKRKVIKLYNQGTKESWRRNWSSGEDMFNWWIARDRRSKEPDDQGCLFTGGLG